jgi:hypothetical protein
LTPVRPRSNVNQALWFVPVELGISADLHREIEQLGALTPAVE